MQAGLARGRSAARPAPAPAPAGRAGCTRPLIVARASSGAAEAVAALLAAAGGAHRVQREQVEPAVEAVKAAGQKLGLDRVNPAFIPGAFVGALTTDVRAISAADDTTTLGRLTFNQFKPADQAVQLGQFSGSSGDAPREQTGLPDLYRGPFEGLAQGYCLFTHFTLLEPGSGAAAQQTLQGVMTAVAEYSVPGEPPSAMTVAFRRLRLQPLPSVQADPARLARWLALLQPHNPTMDGQGCAEVSLPPNGPVGSINYLLMDKDEQVHVGNMGSVLVMRRYEPRAGTLGAALLAAA